VGRKLSLSRGSLSLMVTSSDVASVSGMGKHSSGPADRILGERAYESEDMIRPESPTQSRRGALDMVY